MQSIAVYLHVYNCLVIIIEYSSALHAMTLMGGAAASETQIGGYIWTIGGCSTPKSSLERTRLSMNKYVKEFMHNNFREWYASQMLKQVEEGADHLQCIDLSLSILKPLGARWLISLYDYL